MVFELTDVHHITLRVADLQRSRNFYEGVLGLTVDQAFRGKLRFRLGSMARSSRLVLLPPLPGTAPDDRFSEQRIGLDHVAVGVDSAAQLERLVQVLRDAGVPTEGVQAVPGGGTLVCFRDPDHIQWEFFDNG